MFRIILYSLFNSAQTNMNAVCCFCTNHVFPCVAAMLQVYAGNNDILSHMLLLCLAATQGEASLDPYIKGDSCII